MPQLDAADLARLPDRAALTALISTARQTYGLPGGIAIAAIPGSETAIRLIPTIAPAGPAAIVGPTYSSHAEAWRDAGRDTVEVGSLDDVTDTASVVVLANPNNPDGRLSDPARLAALARHLGNRGGLLIVDEAFADVAPEASLAPHLAGLSAIVLRSFGKFFGLAGLRLGFVAGQRTITDRLARLLGDWPVSATAIAVGREALADAAWQEQARQRLGRDSSRLRDMLSSCGLAIEGGTDLFVLVRDADAGVLHRALAGRGIWTRAFPYRRDWLRIGIPGDEAAFARLGEALAAISPGR